MYPSLAIDCSDKVSLIAISDGNEHWQITGTEARNQAKTIISSIDACLAQAQLTKTDLKTLCWATGPGSFTGLRIATSVMQGMSYALNIPLIGVSSLEFMAASAVADIEADIEIILVVSDARMGEFYWAIFEADQAAGKVIRKTPDSLSDSATLWEFIRDQDMTQRAKIACIGSGAQHISAGKEVECSFVFVDSQSKAQSIFQIAEREIEQGNQINAMQAQPSYLRSKNAWKTLEQQ